MKLYTIKRDTNFRRSNTSVFAATLLDHSNPPKIGKTTRTTKPISTNSIVRSVEIPSLPNRSQNNTSKLALVSRGRLRYCGRLPKSMQKRRQKEKRMAAPATKKTNTRVQMKRSKPKARPNMIRVAESVANSSQIKTLSGGAMAVATDFVQAVDLAQL